MIINDRKKFTYNFLTRLVAAEVLVVLFGKYGVELGVKFGVLWLIAMTPIILYIYREEWGAFSKIYSKEEAEKVTNNLLVSRYMTRIYTEWHLFLGDGLIVTLSS